MKLIFALIFLVLVALFTFLTKPIYRLKIEGDLLTKTNSILNDEGLHNIEVKIVRHEIQFNAKDGTKTSMAIREITKAIKVTDQVWGVYLPENPVPQVLRSANLVGLEKPEGVLLLSGELPNEALRSQIVAAAKLIPGVSEVDDQLVVVDDIANPVWGSEISDLLNDIVGSAESGRVFINDNELEISGVVETDARKAELGSLAKNFPHGKDSFQNNLWVELWNEPSLRIQRKDNNYTLTGVLPDEVTRQLLLKHVEQATGDASLLDQTTLTSRTRAPWWLKNSEIFLSKFFEQSIGPAFVSYSAEKMEVQSTVSAQNIKSQLTRLAYSGVSTETRTERALEIAVVEPEHESEPVVGIGPKPATLGKVQIDLKNLAVYFDTSSSSVKSAETSKIEKAAALINYTGLAKSKLTVGGYADLRGNADFNRKLSLRRANAVRDKLIKLGVPADSLKVEFFGEDTAQVAPRDLWKCRRVEISFNKTSGAR